MLTNFLVGIAGARITVLLAPPIQNYFWRYQRRSEIQLRAIDKLNHFAAEFMNSTIRSSIAPIRPQMFDDLSVVDAEIKALFSDDSYQRFKELRLWLAQIWEDTLSTNSWRHEIAHYVLYTMR